VGIKTKAPAISTFRGSFTWLLCSLHTLDAAISDDSPMLASGRLPPFPGGLSGPAGFLQRISTSGYPIVSFLSGFILTLYTGFDLEQAQRSAIRQISPTSYCPFKTAESQIC
jgi:hypothetical protein